METTPNTLSDSQLFENAVKPLMNYLKEHHHPHMTVIVDSTRAELVEGQISYVDHDFISG